MTFKHKLSVRLALLRDALALVPVAGLLACERPLQPAASDAIVTRVAISPAHITLQTSQRSQFTAVGLTATGDTANIAVTWSATGGTIAYRFSNGREQFADYQPSTLPGNYVVVAATGPGGLSDTGTVTVVHSPVASVTLNRAVASILAGATLQLAATPLDASGGPLYGRVVTWSSSAPAVATVADSGLVTGLVAGSATITASVEGQTGSAVLSVTAAAPPRPGFYVSPTGSPNGDGSATRPWNLATALAGPAAVRPGDTVWLREGTYSGTFTNRLNGTPAQPIIVRQYPGERATIRGNLVIFGSYTWFWGFEVVSPTPAAGAGGIPGGSGGAGVTNGIQSRSTGAKFINLVIHDAAGVGLTLFDDIGGSGLKPDQEAYGCLIYNNGNTNNFSHGIYANNQTGYRKIRDNIVFNNWALGFSPYPNTNDLTIDGNIAFNNGSISGYAGGPTDLLVAPGGSATVTRVTNNYLYRLHSLTSTANIGYAGTSSNLIYTGNYTVGLVNFKTWTRATVTGNTAYSVFSPYAEGARGQLGTMGSLSGHTWSGNTWYGNAGMVQWGYNQTGYTYAGWLAATGLRNPGTHVGGTPPNHVAVRPNAYEAGRANIVVYNWALLATVSVDVSGALKVGDRYVVKNVQDFYGAPVLSGTYTGGSLQLPIAAVPAPRPIGRGVPGPTTGPTFNAYVLLTTP